MSEIKEIAERKEIAEYFRWDIGRLYPDEDQWEKDMKWIAEERPSFTKFKGRLKDPETIAELFILTDEISRKLEKVFTYAHLKHDEDLRVTRYQELHDRAMNEMNLMEMDTSFIIPEILQLPASDLESLLVEDVLEFARVPLKEIIRKKDHFLSKEEEMLLAMSDDALDTPGKAFRMLNDADLTFPSIKNESGEEVELSHGRYISFMISDNREVRKNAFKALYSVYRSHRNTFAALLEGELKKRMFRSKARKYTSSLASSLDNDEVTPDVYDSLIEAVRNHLPSMHDYLDIRRRVLDIEQVHMYDVYAPLVKDFERTVPYEEAWEMVIEALRPLGDEVNSILNEARNGRWIDVYENRGKRSGAYSSGCYDSIPYILMNYEGKVNDIFTLAHELGHSIHTYLANENQPHINADYRIFVAEVASTVNENLLLHYLSGKWISREERIFLTNHHLDSFKGTVFRQTMFAEFEKEVSSIVEERIPLTAEGLSSRYGDLNKAHFGPRTYQDEEISLEWARIPHFYYNFYVYKYATGFSAASAISNRILRGKGDLEDYLGMLKAGGSKPPLELLRDAGVDLETPQPVNEGLDLFDSLVERLGSLL
jgi:oligoendopeptidase F